MNTTIININLNRPHKWTILSILNDLQRKGYVYLTSTRKITANITPQNKIAILREIIPFAHYLEKQANLTV